MSVTVHDHVETPSAIRLKRASTIAEIRNPVIELFPKPKETPEETSQRLAEECKAALARKDLVTTFWRMRAWLIHNRLPLDWFSRHRPPDGGPLQ